MSIITIKGSLQSIAGSIIGYVLSFINPEILTRFRSFNPERNKEILSSIYLDLIHFPRPKSKIKKKRFILPPLLDDAAHKVRAVDGVALLDVEARNLAVVGRGDDHFLDIIC